MLLTDKGKSHKEDETEEKNPISFSDYELIKP